MKKFGILVIALTLFVVGMAMAEPGIPKVNEVQGLAVSTTVIAAGNFNQASSVDLTIASGESSLTEVPPLTNGTYYQSVYTEDTQNSEVGFISYDKDLDVSTANKVSGQYNIQAVKQVTYLGVDASSMITNDYMMVDGAGDNYGTIGDKMLCPFGAEKQAPSFCNRVETGSNMNLKVANLNTQMGDRFIMKSADPGVAIFNNVGVSSYAADLPSKGSVSAFIRGSIKEGGRETTDEAGNVTEPAEDLYETMVFSDITGVSGDISTFAKSMSYSSVFA
ncbi:MAG: hypothetical protein LUQ61_06590 [Methanoregulaceae archaeon]|nr:hypothetical protein [Methanoregulaceae archaeon]